jgi:hypothetical protein
MNIINLINSLRVYFERIYPGAPFVHKDRLLASFESDNQPNPALLYVIYAMAVCQTNQVRDDIVSVYPASFFQSRALWHVQKNLAELKDLFQTVQALAFLTVFETGLSKRASNDSSYGRLTFRRDACISTFRTGTSVVSYAWFAFIGRDVRRESFASS